MFRVDDRVLVVAPHADDETLGAGGTIARLAAMGAEVHVAVLTGHGGDWNHLGPPEAWEPVREECRRAMSILGVENLHFRELPAAMLATHPVWETNQVVLQLVIEIAPTVLLVPFPFDLHKDHREVFQACNVAWRTSSAAGQGIRLVLAYEVQSETHWNPPYLEAGFLPSVWVDISAQLETKLRALETYASQMRPFPDARSVKAIESLALWRGSQQNLNAAEAFVLVRALDGARAPAN